MAEQEKHLYWAIRCKGCTEWLLLQYLGPYDDVSENRPTKVHMPLKWLQPFKQRCGFCQKEHDYQPGDIERFIAPWAPSKAPTQNEE